MSLYSWIKGKKRFFVPNYSSKWLLACYPVMCASYPCCFFKQSLRTVILELTLRRCSDHPQSPLPSGGAGSHYQLQGLRLQSHVVNNDHLSAFHSAVHELHLVSFFQDLPDRHHRDKKTIRLLSPGTTAITKVWYFSLIPRTYEARGSDQTNTVELSMTVQMPRTFKLLNTEYSFHLHC